MNGEDFCRVLLERSSRPLRPTRPALARSRSRSFASLARLLARPGTGPTASRGEPVRRHDEWSAHYGEVPATKSRDEMSPFACERRVSIRRGEARRGRRREKWMLEIRRTIIGRASSLGRRDRLASSFIGSRRSPPLPGTGRALRVSRHAVGAMPERAGARLPIVTLARGRVRHCGGRYAQCRAIARPGADVPSAPPSRRQKGGEKATTEKCSRHTRRNPRRGSATDGTFRSASVVTHRFQTHKSGLPLATGSAKFCVIIKIFPHVSFFVFFLFFLLLRTERVEIPLTFSCGRRRKRGNQALRTVVLI